jgi:RAD51-like protein 2
MQLCVTSQFDQLKDSNDKPYAIYIDTEGSFSSTRMKQIALTFLDRTYLTIQTIMSRIKIIRIMSLNQLTTIVDELDMVFKQDPSIRLVVVDSIAFHFRSSDDMV